MNELEVTLALASGALPSPQEFCGSWYWCLRVSGTGVAYRSALDEFCLRERSIWLSPEMIKRASCLPDTIDHAATGTLTSQEFAARCVGMTTHAFVRDDELWSVARIIDAAANEILLTGAYEDTSPSVQFEPGTGSRIFVDGKPLFIEPSPLLVDSLAICARGVWTRSGQAGVEVTEPAKAA